MPTLFIIGELRFFFYALDHEPIHVHVESPDGDAKFKIEPEIEMYENNGLNTRQVKKAKQAIKENKEVIIERWKELH